MPASPHPLQELRDVHLPDPVSWWPPAPGWWVVFGLVVLGVLLCMWIMMSRRRTKIRRTAMAELKRISRHYHSNQKNDHWVVQRLSELLRRYAMTAFPRGGVAGLTGNAWLQFLDRTGRTNQFSEGAGRLLQSEPYRPQTSMSAVELMMLVEQWIQRVPPKTSNTSTRGKAG